MTAAARVADCPGEAAGAVGIGQGLELQALQFAEGQAVIDGDLSGAIRLEDVDECWDTSDCVGEGLRSFVGSAAGAIDQ